MSERIYKLPPWAMILVTAVSILLTALVYAIVLVGIGAVFGAVAAGAYFAFKVILWAVGA